MTGGSPEKYGSTSESSLADRACPLWLEALPVLIMVSLLAGSSLAVPLAGRQLPLGLTEFVLATTVALLPWWWRFHPPVSGITLAAYFFIIWCLASAVLWSLDMRRSVLSSLDLIKAAIAFIACYNVFMLSRRNVFAFAVRAFTVILALQLFWVGWQYYNELGVLSYFGLKKGIVVPIGGSNFVAIFLEFGIIYELITRRRGWLPTILLFNVALLLTLSRGAFVALALTLAIGSVIGIATRGQRMASLAFLGLAVVGAAVFSWLPLGQIVLDAYDSLGRSIASRMSFWQVAVEVASESPLTGIGFGAFESVGEMRDTHSTFFELLSETGVIGVVLFTAMIGGVIAKAFAMTWASDVSRWDRREHFALSLALLGVFVHSMIEPFFLSRSAIWVACVFAWMVVMQSDVTLRRSGSDESGSIPRDIE